MRSALRDWFATESEPLTRLELWLGIITMYLVLSAYVMGQFARYADSTEKQVIPITNRA